MKAIAGSIIVLSGAVLMGLAKDQIPSYMLPTVTSFGLIAVGLFLVFSAGKDSSDQ